MTLIAPPPHSPDAEPPGDVGGSPAPTPVPPPLLTRADAEEMGLRIQHQAALIAQATCEFLHLLADFDRREGSRWFVGLKSTAHWLGWACLMAAGTAREHLRVARALPDLPLTVAEFRVGRLSYSKVREITRVADRVEEEVLVEMARAMTASQLARTVSSFRAVDGTRLDQDSRREARWHVREDGMVEIRAVLPAETGAELLTALELSLDRDGTRPPSGVGADVAGHGGAADRSVPVAPDFARAAEITTDATLDQRRADALHDLARTYLAAEPDDRSGEDRHLVVVQVSADSLRRHVPAGTPQGAGSSRRDVPAGTPRGAESQRCGILGGGPLEPATAERLACTGKVALAIADADGEVLHLGRSRRLASRAQRRALRLRDGTCVFPGCHQSRHLDAHHLTPWSGGGPTDLDELALLCRRHHVMVHEGGLRLVHTAPDPAGSAIGTAGSTDDRAGSGPRLQAVDADGRPVQARWPAMFEHLILRPEHGEHPLEAPGTPEASGALGLPSGPDAPAAPGGPDPERIAATTGGAGFRLADCVQALCENVLKRAA
jgi:hypothetical protein